MRRIRWRGLAAATAGLVCLSAALSGVASAAPMTGGVKGDPQPELRPFEIAASGYAGGGVAIEPDGSLVVAYGVTSGDGKTVVCLLNRGAGKCSHRVTLTPPGGIDMFGVPQVFVTSADHVVVLMETTTADLLWTSDNGGASFGAPVGVGGTIDVSVAALVGGQILFMGGDDGGGAQVEAVPVDASGAPSETATPTARAATDVGLGGYKGGALVASDYDGTSYTTYVEYAPAGANFDATGSYHSVGSFPREQLIGMSGDALLTQETTGSGALKLRLFNGKTFGPAHVVPGTSGGGPEWFAIDQDPRGKVFVFSERADAPVTYGLYDVSTSTGATWSGAVYLGDAIQNNTFAADLDSNGSGLVLGTAPAWGYPVLAPQSASLRLKSARIAKGRTTTASGTAGPAAKGRAVALQVLRSGLWYTVATTHENAGGGFSFTIKGGAIGTFSYRAVVSDFAGYVEYGYSAARSLRVVS